jgi:hypothetical protein
MYPSLAIECSWTEFENRFSKRFLGKGPSPPPYTHIVKKNKSGHEIPRIKTITSLATPGDGHGLAHPPIVPKFAAGAKEVKFFLGASGEQSGGKEQGSAKKEGKKGKKAGKPGPERPQEGYISVYDFFQRSKYLSPSVSYKMPLAYSISRPQHYCKGS